MTMTTVTGGHWWWRWCDGNDITKHVYPHQNIDDIKLFRNTHFALLTLFKLKTVVEEILKCHFGEIELVLFLKSLQVRNFLHNFRGISPFPLMVTWGSNRGQILKMFKMAFHVYQITRSVIRITKIYSLLYVRLMVKEILTEVIQRSSGVKFSTMSDWYECHVKLLLLTCTLQNTYM